ncbi:unnamed protein product [Rhodiola kirilowii]
MSSSSTEFVTSRRMGIYDPLHQMNKWKDTLRPHISMNSGDHAVLVQVDSLSDSKMKGDHSPHESFENFRSHHETNKPPEKIQRRLAQNREAARKSRLRKKAYVQQLESSRLKLSELEQDLERARSQAALLQGAFIASALESSHNIGLFETLNPGITAFEMEYALWVEVQQEQILELRNALQTQTTDEELNVLVGTTLNHYDSLFRMKGEAAKADVFYLISGMWRTPAERFFLWIGGFRPSELLKVLIKQIEPLSDQQHISISKLRQSSEQAEEALSKGIDRLQQTLSHSIAAKPIGEGCYLSQVSNEMQKLDGLENFVIQADHLRQQTLQNMSRILTPRQAARGLLALGEYFHRFRALSILWAARPL